jgi:hypothetical protein
MNTLEDVLDLVPLAARKALATRESNVALLPATAPTAVRHGPLVHTDAGPPGDDTPPTRVIAILGPGATFRGIAEALLPLYTQAGVAKPLTVDDLAKGLVFFNRNYLPAGSWDHHKVGLCLPLPIEISVTGEWVVNADEVRGWAGSFVAAWRPRLTTPPALLPVLEPAQIEGEANAVLAAGTPASRAAALWQRVLRNPFEVVLTLFAVLRQVTDAVGGGPDQALTLALTALDGASAGQLRPVAATRAGNGILRRFERVLAGPPPVGTDAAKLAAAKGLVDNALRQGPAGSRTLVPHQEVPETVDLLAARAGSAKAVPGATTDPPGGLHRVVLGRDVGVGRSEAARVGAVTFTGPLFAGRVVPDPFLEDDAKGLNPGGDADRAGRLVLLPLDSPGARFDAVQARDAGLLSAGLRSWSALDPAGLAALLFEFKVRAFDEFDLYFALHGLDVDVDPADVNKLQLRKIGADGTSSVMTAADLQAFLGGTVDTKGNLTFSPEWAARFRLPALTSRRYRRAQVLLAIRQTTVDKVELAVAAVKPFPAPYALAFDAARSNALKKAVDADVPPFLTGLHTAHVDAGDTLAGAVIDLTGGVAVTPAYAGVNDTDTFYVGSMGKVAAMYAALELRTRLRKAFVRAKPHLNVAVAGWHVTFLAAVRKTWSGRIAKGFPGFDTTMPARLPKFTDMFDFPAGAGAGINFTKGTATIPDIVALKLRRPTANMKFEDMIMSMLLMSNPFAAGNVITGVGYPYLNGVLREAGFFHPATSTATSTGIWVSASYDSRDWKPGVDPVTLSARGTRHYKAKTNLVGNAREFARMLALADRNELFGGDVASCDDLRRFMKKFGIPGADRSFNREAVDDTPVGIGDRKPPGTPELVVDEVFSKLGIGDPASAHGPQGIHDCAIIQRKKGLTTLRYVVVGVGGYPDGSADPDDGAEGSTYYELIQMMDGAVASLPHP